MATVEIKNTNVTERPTEDENADDGYSRSCSSSPIDRTMLNESIECSSTYSSGIDTTDDESQSDSSSDQQPPKITHVIDNPKFNPETRAMLSIESTCVRSDADFFQSPIGCSMCKREFKTIDEMNAHREDAFHVIQLRLIETTLAIEQINLKLDGNNGVINGVVNKKPKIEITAFYTAATAAVTDSDAGATIKIVVENRANGALLKLEHLYWIDKQDNGRLMLFNNTITFPQNINAGSIRKFSVPFERFQAMRKYELITYFECRDKKYVTKCSFHVTNRPIITMKLSKLAHYFPATSVRSLQKTKFELRGDKIFTEDEKLLHGMVMAFKNADEKTRLTSENYHAMLKLMLQMEDETDSAKCLSHDQENQIVVHVREQIYSLKITSKNMDEAAAEYTRLWITPMSMRAEAIARNDGIRKALANNPKADVQPWRTQRIYGTIVKVKKDQMLLQLDKHLDTFTLKTKIEPNVESYFIRFMSNRTTIALEHRALDLLNQHKISKFFFPKRDNLLVDSVVSNVDDNSNASQIEWISDVNDEQRSAVENILKRTSYPFPYILFGPPGTGKTKTVVEAIAQIVKRNVANEHILVCATSNSACDELAGRLLDIVRSDQMFRMFSMSQTDKMDGISRKVLDASNLCKAEHYYPTLLKLYQYKVVICTLTTAGRLSQARVNALHFSHVFVDESGSATESQLLIPIAGICTSENKIHANIIFAGDPKQLGPIIKSQMAIKLGYGVSMLERLMNSDVYDRDSNTKKFNAKYVTQLVRNYRSHETILHVSNDLFYENALQVEAPESNTNWFLNSPILSAPNFPFIFHSVQGRTTKLPKETSLFNCTEINLVVAYLEKLFNGNIIERKITQNDVGIISPYRKQCEKLMEKFQQLKWPDIQIGSVETFQGQEKPIIIVSTVRARTRSIGFLNNAKRLNVLLTRAKCLMIIIGDAKTLATDKNWAHVIKYCQNNGSLIKKMCI